MRSRKTLLSFALLLVALLATSCFGSDPEPPAIDRSVDDGADERDRDLAIQRTVLVETAMDNGLGRTAAGCTIDTTLEAGDVALDDLDGVDLSARTHSGVDDDLAALLADALVDCGPSLRDRLAVDIPGALHIPATHAAESECVTNAYVDAWRDAYTDRFTGRPVDDEEPSDPDVSEHVVGIVAGCRAGGAVVIGASNAGNLDTFALNTLEWECLDARIDPDDFMPAFPFPEEPGDALDRMGDAVLPDVAYCTAWVRGEDPDAAESSES